MKRKLTVILLIAALILSFAACAKPAEPQTPAETAAKAPAEPAPAAAEQQAPETEQPAAEPQQVPAEQPAGQPEYLPVEPEENYHRRYAADHALADLIETDAELTAEAQTGAADFAAVPGTELRFVQPFRFDGLPVSRFSFGAASEQPVTLAFYLDDEQTPFVQAQLSPFKSNEEIQGMLAKGLKYRDRTTDISALNLTGEHTLRVRVLDAAENAAVSLCYVEFAASTVPTIYLDIDETQGTVADMNADPDHKTKCHGTMTMQVPEDFICEYTGEHPESGVYALDYMRGRGNSTWNYSKKPYKIKLEKGADLLGMGKAKEWALIANYCDNSLLRNKITYWLGEQTGMAFTPQSEPVDVVLAGEYLGSYMLSETVQVKETRVAIDDLEKDEETMQATDPETVSGGYLISLAARPADDDGQASFYTDNYRFFMESPSFEDGVNEVQMAYITDYLTRVENAIFSGEWVDRDGTPIEELLDFHSTAIYFMLQTFSGNSDAFITDSTFLYKERGGKLYFGPLWDFDYTTWGETQYAGWEEHGYEDVSSGGCDTTLWIDALLSYEPFRDELKAAWGELRAAMEQLVADGGQLEWYRERMRTTGFYGFEVIGPSQIYMIDPNGRFDSEEVTLTWEQEVDRLKDWMTLVIPRCDIKMDELIPAPVLLSIVDSVDGSELGTVEALMYESLPELPDAPEKEGYIFLGYTSVVPMSYEEALDYGRIYEEDLTPEEIAEYKANGYPDENDASRTGAVLENMYLKANYIAAGDYIPVTSISFIRDRYEEEVYGGGDDLRAVILPENATLLVWGKIVYTTSDDSVAYPAGEGYFYCGTEGEAVITAEADGISASAVVVVKEPE